MTDTQVIGIDIGRDATKVSFDGKEFKFNSAIVELGIDERDYSSDVKGFTGKRDEGVYSYKGREYLVGDTAVKNIITSRGNNFLFKYGPLLIYHALKLAKVDFNRPILISTGLSITDWKYSKKFTDLCSNFKIDGKELSFTFNLMAQGEGIYHDYDGRKDGLVIVNDIGYRSFDSLAFINGEPQSKISYANTDGIHLAVTKLRAIMSGKLEEQITEHRAKKCFRDGFIIHRGKKIDFSGDIKLLKKDYIDSMLDNMEAINLDVLLEARKIIFSGGGAYALKGKRLPSNVVFDAKGEYEYANVRGYVKRGLELL